MRRSFEKCGVWLLIVSTLLTGCQPIQPYYLQSDGDLSHYLDVATDIEYTDAGQEPLDEVRYAHAPRTVANPEFESFWDLRLEDAISLAMQNSKVIRTFGVVRQFGQIVASPPERLMAAPDSVATIYDVAIQETGQSGVEQALSTFDAVFSSSVTWDNTDRLQNVAATVPQAQSLQQDSVQINNEISKLSANGTQWFFRNVSNYTGANNANTRQFRDVSSDWFTAIETEVRHPLMRNRGAQLNRIPVVLARIRTDLSLIDFEISVRDMLYSVERAYWELNFFYHNLRAAKTGRDSALASWQKVSALYEQGAPGGEAEKETQAREQYFFFRARVEDAQRDLFKSENRLRYLMGLAPTDGRLIRPIDKPTVARVHFDWSLIKEETLARNPEGRRQGWRIRQRELELIAARNQLLPQFDAVALYRWLGVGDQFKTNRGPSTGQFFPESAVDNFFGGDLQEYRLGMELQMPLGFRRELSQVRSSQLALARERARMEDMELEAVHALSDAVQDVDAGYRAIVTNFSRRVAADEQVEAVQEAYLAGTVVLDLLLDAQRRQADAIISYYQALLDYNNSLLTLHLRKGSLLEYNGVLLAEGPWPAKAYFDAVNEARRRDASYYLDYGYSRPRVLSRGAVPQHTGASGGAVSAAAPQETEERPLEAIPFASGSEWSAPQPPAEDGPVEGAPDGGASAMPEVEFDLVPPEATDFEAGYQDAVNRQVRLPENLPRTERRSPAGQVAPVAATEPLDAPLPPRHATVGHATVRPSHAGGGEAETGGALRSDGRAGDDPSPMRIRFTADGETDQAAGAGQGQDPRAAGQGAGVGIRWRDA